MSENRLFQRVDNGTAYLIAFFVSFAWLLLGAMFYLIPMLTVGLLKTDMPLIDFLGDENLVSIYTFIPMLTSSVLGIGVFGYIFWKIFKIDFKNFKQHWLMYFALIIVGFGVIWASQYLIDYIYSLLGFGNDETSTNQQMILDALNGDLRIFVILSTVVAAPIFEELIFRKFLYGFLKHKAKLSTWIVVSIVAIIFAGIHVISDLESLKYFPAYFVLSFLITSAYALSKENIFVVTGLHFLNNLMSVLGV